MSDSSGVREGARVVVSVDGERRRGTVAAVDYTLRFGETLLAVDLDRPSPTGRERVACPLDAVERP